MTAPTKTSLTWDREDETVDANISGVVSKHYGRVFVDDFQCDIELISSDEQEYCETALIELAREENGGFLPEMEPDARPYARRD